MTIIRARCFQCGEVLIKAKNMALYEFGDNDYQYDFECPECYVMNVKDLDDYRIFQLLRSAKVALRPTLDIHEIMQFDAEALTHAIEEWRAKGARK